MKTHSALKRFINLSVGFGLCMAASAQLEVSQEAKFRVEDPQFEELQSPEINDGNAKNFKPKDWLEIEVKFVAEVESSAKPADDYLDEITVNWHVVVKGQDRKVYKISKSVTHVNVPIGEDLFVSVYLSPNTLRRITGNPKASKSDLEAIGGEIAWKGKMVGYFTHGEKAGWWRQPLKGVEATNKFPLLDKNQTPFAPLWYDRYAEVKPKD